MRWEPAAVQQIINDAAGHPYFLQLLASETWQAANPDQGTMLDLDALQQGLAGARPDQRAVWGLDVAGTPEPRQRPLSVDIEDVEQVPAVQVYPLSDHVADKVAGMCELTGGRPSSRYRDLMDLALITAPPAQLNHAEIAVALQIQQARRSEFTVPNALEAPTPQWPAKYLATAAKTGLDLGSFDAAVEQVNTVLRRAFHWARTSTRAELKAQLTAGRDGDPMGAAFPALPSNNAATTPMSAADARRSAPTERRGPRR